MSPRPPHCARPHCCFLVQRSSYSVHRVCEAVAGPQGPGGGLRLSSFDHNSDGPKAMGRKRSSGSSRVHGQGELGAGGHRCAHGPVLAGAAWRLRAAAAAAACTKRPPVRVRGSRVQPGAAPGRERPQQAQRRTRATRPGMVWPGLPLGIPRCQASWCRAFCIGIGMPPGLHVCPPRQQVQLMRRCELPRRVAGT